jgi:hypothetical protein
LLRQANRMRIAASTPAWWNIPRVAIERTIF